MKEDAEILLARIDERQEAMFLTMQDVLEEAKKTNGRVTGIEVNMAALKNHPERLASVETWRNKIQGAWKAVVIIAIVFGALLGYGVTYLAG